VAKEFEIKNETIARDFSSKY